MTQKVTLKKADEWRPIFLLTLRENGNVRAACEQAGISRKTAYQHREASKEFMAQWDEALEDAIDTLEEEARKRATNNSDTLLIFLLKAHRPDKYRETTRQEHTGKDGGVIMIEHHFTPTDVQQALAQLAGARHAGD